MSTRTAYSTNPSPSAAVGETVDALGATDPALVVAFSSPALDPAIVVRDLAAAFPNAHVVGCTTAGEIVDGKMLKGALAVMALEKAVVGNVDVRLVKGLSSEVDVTEAISGFSEHFGEPAATMSVTEYVGLVLADGLSGAEERLMQALGNSTNVLFVGGSAGDDVAFDATYVFADGEAVTDAAVLVLMKPLVGFDVVKTQSFVASGATLRATDVDEATREVHEFNGRPAVHAYAEAIGVPVVEAADHFMNQPVGLMIDGEPFVRSPQQVLDDGTIRFYCNIMENMQLDILESTSIVEDTAAALAQVEDELGGISAMINFNCILRTLELEAKGLTEEYGALFAGKPAVGFSTYGEQYYGHINQTATMLVFGEI